MKILPAGRELDLAIAEKVMGWKLVNYNTDKPAVSPEDYADAANNDGWCWDGLDGEAWEWKPSTDIAAAFQVEQHLKSFNIRLEINPTVEGYQVSCIRYTPDSDPDFNCAWTGIGHSVSYSDSLPHAICLAALKARE